MYWRCTILENCFDCKKITIIVTNTYASAIKILINKICCNQVAIQIPYIWFVSSKIIDIILCMTVVIFLSSLLLVMHIITSKMYRDLRRLECIISYLVILSLPKTPWMFLYQNTFNLNGLFKLKNKI